MPSSRRRFLAALSALSAVPVVASCASPGPGEADSSAGATADSGADGAAFPVTIQHKFGETVIEKAPTRVVCVGLTEQDALLALGVVPVGVTDWFTDGTPGCIYPWAADKLGGAALPEVLSNADGVQIEKIAALEPDLIIGQYAGLKESEYEQLSKLAPTVAQPGDVVDYGVAWEDATRTIGAAVGRPAEADTLVGEVNALITRAAAANKELFSGQSAVAATVWEGIWIYGPQDPRGRLLQQLGLAFPKALENPESEKFGWSISGERIGDFEGVGAVAWIVDEEQVNEITGNVWAGTGTAKEGRGIFVDSATAKTYGNAFSFVTALSIPYLLERYVPQLVAALDGNPGTKVPEVTE